MPVREQHRVRVANFGPLRTWVAHLYSHFLFESQWPCCWCFICAGPVRGPRIWQSLPRTLCLDRCLRKEGTGSFLAHCPSDFGNGTGSFQNFVQPNLTTCDGFAKFVRRNYAPLSCTTADCTVRPEITRRILLKN